MRLARPTTAELGLCGERLVARHLRARGWRVLGRRVRTPHAELDLLALDGSVLVAVEVKTGRVRADARHAPREHLSARTLRRQLAALRALRPRGEVRVDLVEVRFGSDASVALEHVWDLRPACSSRHDARFPGAPSGSEWPAG